MSQSGGILRTASWALVAFFSCVVLIFSCASALLAYSGSDYPIAGEPVAGVAAGRAEIEVGLRAIRGTSAAYALAFGILMLSITLGPYRQGSRWSWWTLLAANLGLLLVTLLRIPTLGTTLGVGSASLLTGLIVVSLLLDVGRLRSSGA